MLLVQHLSLAILYRVSRIHRFAYALNSLRHLISQLLQVSLQRLHCGGVRREQLDEPVELEHRARIQLVFEFTDCDSRVRAIFDFAFDLLLDFAALLRLVLLVAFNDVVNHLTD